MYEHLQLIKDNVVRWLQSRLIERSSLKFNKPILCVPKPHGHGLHIVLDYCSLNDKSVQDKYSIRTIDQCIDEIERVGSKIVSCLDLMNGFKQLKLDPAYKPYTAFTIN